MGHTQGEWESIGIAIKDLKDPTFSHVDILCGGMIRVARSSGVGNSQTITNARLIAAAPDLLAACEVAKKAIYEAINKRPAELSIAYHDLEQAITKAKQ